MVGKTRMDKTKNNRNNLMWDLLDCRDPAWAQAVDDSKTSTLSKDDFIKMWQYLEQMLSQLRMFVPASNPSYGISERGGDAILAYVRADDAEGGYYLFFADVSGFTALLSFLTEKFGKEEAGDIMNLGILNLCCLNRMGQLTKYFCSAGEEDRGLSALKTVLGIRAVMPFITSEVRNELRRKLAGKPHQHTIEKFVTELTIKASAGLIYDDDPKMGFYGKRTKARITWGSTGRMIAQAEKIGGSDDKVSEALDEIKGIGLDQQCYGKLEELIESGWLGLTRADFAANEQGDYFLKVVITPSGLDKIGKHAWKICSNTSSETTEKKEIDLSPEIADRNACLNSLRSEFEKLEHKIANRHLIIHIAKQLGASGAKNVLLADSASAIRNSGILFCNFEISGSRLLDELVDVVGEIMERYGIHYKYNISPKGDFNLMGVLGTEFSQKIELDRYYSEIIWNAWQDLVEVLNRRFGDEVKIRGGLSVGKALQGPAGDNILFNEETIIGSDCNLAARLVNEALEIDSEGRFVYPSGTLFTVESHRQKIDHLLQPQEPVKLVQLKGFSKQVAIYSLTARNDIESLEEFIARLRKVPLVTEDGKIVEDVKEIAKDELLAQGLAVLEKVERGESERSQLISFIAQSGVGKTRRLAELVNHALTNGWSVFWGECYSWYQGDAKKYPGVSNNEQPESHSDEGSYPFFPFIKILKEQVFGLTNADQPSDQRIKIEQVLRRLESSGQKLVCQAPVIGSFIGLQLEENQFTSSLDAEARRNLFYERVGDIFELCLHSGKNGHPLMICIDDLQWSDHNSLHLLCYLLHRIHQGLVVIVNARNLNQLGLLLDDQLPIERHHFEPTLLNSEAVKKLAAVVLGVDLAGDDDALPGELVNKLVNTLEHNPFFVIEFCRKILDEEIINVTDGRVTRFDKVRFQETAIPTKIEGVIEDRIKRLSRSELKAIQFSSVLGNILRYVIIKQYLPNVDHDDVFRNADIEEIFSRLTGHNITKLENEKDPDSVYSFQRALIGEKLYLELVPSLRKRLHKEIARIIENTSLANRFEKALLTALHYGNGEVPDKAFEFYFKAGRLARDAYDNQRSLQLLDKTDQMLSEYQIEEATGKKIELLGDRGNVNLLIGNYDEALEDFSQLAELAAENGLAEKAAQAHFLLARAHFTRSLADDYNLAAEQFAQAAGITKDNRLLAEIENEWARTCLEQGNHDRALELLKSAQEAFHNCTGDQMNTEERIFKASILRNRGSVFHRRGEFKKAIEIYNEALGFVSAPKENKYKKIRAMLLNSIGLSHMKAFELERSLKYYQQALQLANSVGDMRTTVLVANNMGVAYNDSGRISEALELLTTQHDRVASLVGETRELAMLKFNIGESYMFMEKYDCVEPYYRQALVIGERLGYQEFVVATRYNLAELLEKLGNQDEALEVLQPAYSIAVEKKWNLQWMDIANLQGEIFRKKSMWKLAREKHVEALNISEQLQDTFGKSWALRNLAVDMIGSGNLSEVESRECERMLHESLELARKAGQPENLLHSLNELIEWKISGGFQIDDVADWVDELEKTARKVNSKQFESICADIRNRLK